MVVNKVSLPIKFQMALPPSQIRGNNRSHHFIYNKHFQNYKNMIEHHKKVAGINPDELKAYIRTSVKAPRNLGELIGNKIKKISMSHTDETLKDKDTKIKNQEINKIDLLGFGGLRNSLEEYNGVSSITALRKAIEENPEKYRPYKDLGEGTYIKDSIKDGMVVPSMIFTRKYKGSGDDALTISPIGKFVKCPVKDRKVLIEIWNIDNYAKVSIMGDSELLLVL